jgi:hypothetical protein
MSTSLSLSGLFHVREEQLTVGAQILPGRWGSIILSQGKQHPFFFREHLLEIWRVQNTYVGVSRLDCAFAHEGIVQAKQYRNEGEFIYRVVPMDMSAPCTRADMLWLTWMGEAGATTDKVSQWCAAYWAGQAASDLLPTATSSWEWLFACPLQVVEVLPNDS